jgi:PEP-CTERM/exosortase A-associated glycosyltransferase
MKILHIFDHSIPLHSGYTFRSMNILKEQHALGWETAHVTSPKQGAARGVEDVDGYRFQRSGPLGSFTKRLPVLGEMALMARLHGAITRVVDAEKPDILHAHSPVLNALPAMAISRQYRLPLVYEVRAFWEDAAVDHGTSREGGLRYRATRAVESFALRHASHVTTICEGLRGDILTRGVPAEKVTVIPNAVDAAKFTPLGPKDAELEDELGLKGKKVIGFLGSFYAYEGLMLLVNAMPGILQRIPEARLLLVGGGSQREALEARVAELGIGEAVIMTGRVPHAEIDRYYSLVDVLAYPRLSMRLTDLVTPLKPLEAMALKKPVVASDVGGHKELIRDGETGVLFKAGDEQSLIDATVRLLGDSTLWPKLTEAGRRYVDEERTWARSVARYGAVYEGLLQP